jgi:opacity protein-like surface antigen
MKRVLAGVLALALISYLGYSASAAEMAQPAASQESTSGPGGGMVKEGAERLAIVGSAEYASTYGDMDSANTNFGVSAEYGYMVLDQLELAVRASFDLMRQQDTNYGISGHRGSVDYRSQNYALEFVPKWRPAVEGNISPFIGPKIGARYVTNSETVGGISGRANDAVFDWGAVLGADIFLGKNISLVVEYDYTQYQVDTKVSSMGVPVNGIGGLPISPAGRITVKDNALTLGLAYWW